MREILNVKYAHDCLFSLKSVADAEPKFEIPGNKSLREVTELGDRSQYEREVPV